MSAALRHPIRVRFHECDPQGVVFNAHYLAYFDIAMTELWRELGGYEPMVGDGVDMVVAEARVRYLAPLRFDEEIDLVVRRVELGNTSMTTELAVERDGEAVAEGELRHVFIDPAAGVTAPIPERVRAKLGAYSG
jgi:acyl-CoA thioester hydrolase